MLKGARVLLVEDEPFIYELYQYQLTNYGANVELAADGQIALDKLLADHNYDVLLLDIMLPKIDGITILQKLREYEQSSGKTTLKTIVLTNMGDEYAYEHCAQYGPIGYVVKARFTPNELVEEIERLMA